MKYESRRLYESKPALLNWQRHSYTEISLEITNVLGEEEDTEGHRTEEKHRA